MNPDAPVAGVVQPAGLPLAVAARWAGAACWVELRLHEVLSTWCRDEPDPQALLRWWTLRAARAEVAEAWHRRLPELAEMPRPGFVAPGRPEVDGLLARLERLGPDDGRDHALAAVLEALAGGYAERAGVAVGPADGPTADTLSRAVDVTRADLVHLGGPVDDGWERAVAEVGGLP